jgi:AcrR family transcriptional regulator
VAERPRGVTRERLLESATGVFAARGFENASLEAIAEGAGVTSATVYRHFASKSDLLLAVVERAIKAVPISERLGRNDSSSAADFSALVAAYIDPGLGTLRKLSVELHTVAGRHPEVEAVWLEFNRRAHRALARQLEAAVEAGGVRADLDTDSAANLLLVVIMGLCHLDTFEPGLVGNARWATFLGSTVEELLRRPAGSDRRREEREEPA